MTLVVGRVAGVEPAVRGPGMVDAQPVLQRGVPIRLRGPALQVRPGRGVGHRPLRGPVHLQMVRCRDNYLSCFLPS